jgi:hypothetical protein
MIMAPFQAEANVTGRPQLPHKHHLQIRYLLRSFHSIFIPIY